MKKKIGGWHRIWIVLSLIYFFVVVGYAIYIFPEFSSKIEDERVLEAIELTLSKHKEPFIKEVMNDLKKY